MSSFRKTILTLALFAAGATAMAQEAGGKFPGIGRAATTKEIAAWDIDVRPDFKGLPKGSGSVSQGQDIWEGKCAHCHGIFGESGEVFSPLVGGVTADDIKTGHVANLRNPNYPGRTTFMKVASLSTIWDYINRAMPWTAPKSLTTDEVYSVTAYLLSLNGIVPEDFVLSNGNIAEVQQRMPNRNGMKHDHAMWPGKEFGGAAKPDTANVACMKDCATEASVGSILPAHARNAHGNLAEQNRLIGAQHGVDTSRPEGAAPKAVAAPQAAAKAADPALALIAKHSCTACHAIDKKLVGPAFKDVARKHGDKADYLAGKIKSGGQGIWGPIPMPAQSLPDADAIAIANWLAAGAAGK